MNQILRFEEATALLFGQILERYGGKVSCLSNLRLILKKNVTFDPWTFLGAIVSCDKGGVDTFVIGKAR